MKRILGLMLSLTLCMTLLCGCQVQQKQSQNDLLLSANGYFTLGNNSMALETLDKVNYNDLSSDQKIIYDNIKNNIN